MSDELKKPIYKRWWFWLLVFIVAVGIAGGRGGDGDGNKAGLDENTEQARDAVDAGNKQPSKEDKSASVKETTGTGTTDAGKEKNTETVSQKNAVRKAEQYLRTMPFSKEGLIEQLEYEGFSNADATYAVNKLNVNWNDQAVKKGKQYLNTMPFSKSGLIEQLEFDGFTNAEAAYGVNQLNVNWKEQAVKKAKQYLDIMSFSRSGLIHQLEFDGFTTEEATYAADQVGF